MRAFTKDEAIECIKKANEINDRPDVYKRQDFSSEELARIDEISKR